MSGIVPKEAELNWADNDVATQLATAKAHLFVSNLTIDKNTTLAALAAAEAAFTGYTPVTVATWSAPAIDGTDAAVTMNSQAIFTGTGVGGTGNVYGYYLTNAASNKLLGVEKFTGAPLSQPQNVGLQVLITWSNITRF